MLKVIPTIATALMLTLLISLGLWQLDRADQKRSMQEKYNQLVQSKPISLSESTPKQNYQPIKITGHFDNQHQYLLDNKFYQHLVGYHVITPFIPEHTNKQIFINRGWIPRNQNRDNIPSIKAVKQTITLQGYIDYPSKKSLVLKHINENTWPKRIQSINEIISKSSYPFLIKLHKDQAFGYKRDWKIINMPPAKHTAYAVQWFLLASTLVICYLVLIIKVACDFDGLVVLFGR